MAQLIHINGPPGIGKSTIAELYVDDRPGVLNLDIDRLRRLIGGSRDHVTATGELVRAIALSMAGTHLTQGYDVVVPQYIGRLAELERFEAVARHSGAQFREVVVIDTLERSLERFMRRGHDAQIPWHRDAKEIVERHGGIRLLGDMYDRLTEVVRARPAAALVHSEAGAIQPTYQAVVRALTGEDLGSPSPA